MVERKYSWMAVLSFVFVIFGFVWMIFTGTILEGLFHNLTSFIKLVAYILFISGILFSIFGLIHTIKTGLNGNRLAWFAFFLGILGVIFTILTVPIY